MTTSVVNNNVTLCDASGGAFSVYLNAASASTGPLYFKKTDSSANAVTIDADGAETIDGATTRVLTRQYETVGLVSDGAAWHTFTDPKRFLVARKSADETINNDNSYSTDADLAVTTPASTTFVVDWCIMYVSSAAADWKSGWVLPTASKWQASGIEGIHSNHSALTGIVYTGAGRVPIGCGAAARFNRGAGTLESGDGGTFAVEWAQNTSHADNTTLYEGSYFRLMET